MVLTLGQECYVQVKVGCETEAALGTNIIPGCDMLGPRFPDALQFSGQ